MTNKINAVKRKLDDSISELSNVSWMFSNNPQKDFSRTRKLPFRKVISFLLSIEGGSLTSEMLKHFGCSIDMASSSAFIQQRSKINPHAFPTLFDLFVDKTDSIRLYKGFRLIAADGSDIQIPLNPSDPDSYFPDADNGQEAHNMLHLDAMYDLIRHTYVDASLIGHRKTNERNALCAMVDRSSMKDVLLIADRGYEGFNLMAHIQEKGWRFLIRIQDVVHSRGIAAGLILPDEDEFDVSLSLSLTKKSTNEVKQLCTDRNHYRRLPATTNFDYLPKKNRKHLPAIFYTLHFRIVRFKITENSYETVITNLNAQDFPAEELKLLYQMRWGIETSFRELKHTVGLLHFHAKKVEYIYQEVFARLIMYNFSELIASLVIIQKSDSKYAYKANFSATVHICRQFFLGNVSPLDVEALIRRNVSPIRPGRSSPRRITVKSPVSFVYRVA